MIFRELFDSLWNFARSSFESVDVAEQAFKSGFTENRTKSLGTFSIFQFPECGKCAYNLITLFRCNFSKYSYLKFENYRQWNPFILDFDYFLNDRPLRFINRREVEIEPARETWSELRSNGWVNIKYQFPETKTQHYKQCYCKRRV